MKKYIYRIITLAVALTATAGVFAQNNLRSAYFLDGYVYGYKLNPAFQGERGFFSIPALGISAAVESNLGISTFLYPTEDGKLTTFMNSSVPDDEFMNKLEKHNRLSVNTDIDILSVGWRFGKSYHTIDISTKVDAGVSVPRDLFRFAKVGAADGNTEYDISNVGVRADSRIEVAYGYSRSIKDFVHIGARFKFLMGLAHAEALVDNMHVSAKGSEWKIEGSGNMAMEVPGIKMLTNEEAGKADTPADNDYLSYNFDLPVDGADFMDRLRNRPGSYGGAVDLGISIDFAKYFTVSAAVHDLGAMVWNNVMLAEMPSDPYVFNGFGTISTSDPDQNLNTELESIGKDLMHAFNFKRTAEGAKKNFMLVPTTYLALEARMPFYERLSIGLLGTRRYNGPHSYTEARVSANIAPLKWLSLSTDYGFSDYGHSWGAALNIHTIGFNFFIGADSFCPLFKMTPQYVPVGKLNTNVAFGMVIALGKYHGSFIRK